MPSYASLTIFTPTYNRAHLLPRLYDSLLRQSFKDFLWLIIDDGSTDSTRQLVEQFSGIRIEYHYQTNGGKHRAHNQAVKLCHTELLCVVDSDDYLLPNAVEQMLRCWQQHVADSNVCGIVAPRYQQDIQPTATLADGSHTTLLDLYQKYGLCGETTLVYSTAVLRQFPFPEIDGERFMTEAVVYDRIDQHYMLVYHSNPFVVNDMQDDGLTAHSLDIERRNPQGWALFYNQRSVLLPTLKRRIKAAGQYFYFARLSGQRCPLIHARRPLLVIVAIPWTLRWTLRRNQAS